MAIEVGPGNTLKQAAAGKSMCGIPLLCLSWHCVPACASASSRVTVHDYVLQ